MNHKRRLVLSQSVGRWVEDVTVGLALTPLPLSLPVVTGANDLPNGFHSDPADRLIVATGRHFGLKLVTRDQAILSYGGQGHVAVMGC